MCGAMISAWVTVSSAPRPRYSIRSTWVNGSSRAPKRLFVLRMPLATARTLPVPWVMTVTILSASPSLPRAQDDALFLVGRHPRIVAPDPRPTPQRKCVLSVAAHVTGLGADTLDRGRRAWSDGPGEPFGGFHTTGRVMTVPADGDDALLRAVANGDRPALEALYRRHAPWLPGALAASVRGPRPGGGSRAGHVRHRVAGAGAIVGTGEVPARGSGASASAG